MGRSAMEVGIHNDKLWNRIWHASVAEEAWPALLSTGSLTEEVTPSKVQKGNQAFTTWTPARRGRPFLAERLSPGMTQPRETARLRGKLQAGRKGWLPSGSGADPHGGRRGQQGAAREGP